MTIVEFDNGKFGIRTGYWLFRYSYVDLYIHRFTWSMSKYNFTQRCVGSLQQVQEVYEKVRPLKVIKSKYNGITKEDILKEWDRLNKGKEEYE